MKPEQHRRRMRRLASDATDLVAALNTTYPLRPPNITDSDREVWFKAGQRDVVEFLLKLQEESRRVGNVLET